MKRETCLSFEIRRLVVGQRVRRVQLNRFWTGSKWSYQPEIELENGAILYFTVDEVDDASCYGVRPGVQKGKVPKLS